MFCPNCGADLVDSAKFCPKCGAQLNVVQEQQANAMPDSVGVGQQNIQPQAEEVNGGAEEKPVQKKHTGRIIAIIAAAVVVIAAVIVIIVVTGNRTNEKIIKSYTEYADGVINRKIEYNENGNVISVITYDNEGNIAFQTDYSLGKNENEIKIAIYNDNGLYDSIIGTINSSHTKLSYDDGDDHCEAEYDDAGNLLKSYTYFDDGSSIGFEYSYDEYGSVLSETEIWDNDIDDSYQVQYTYEYSFNNDGSISNRKAFKGGTLICEYDYIYEYY